MKKVILTTIFCILILCGCGNQANKATLPISYEDAIGENYETVISYFEKAGFTNIEFEPTDDLLNESDAYRVDTIKEIEIDGSTEFEKDEKMDLASNIVIKYHTYAKCEIPTSIESVKGMAYEEIENIFMNSKFFNV